MDPMNKQHFGPGYQPFNTQLYDANHRFATPDKSQSYSNIRNSQGSPKQEATRTLMQWMRLQAKGQYEFGRCEYISGDKQKNGDSQLMLVIRPVSNSNSDVQSSMMSYLSDLFAPLVDRTNFPDMEILYSPDDGYSCILKWNLVEELLRAIEKQSNTNTNTNAGYPKSFRQRFLSNSEPTGLTPIKPTCIQQKTKKQSSSFDESQIPSIEIEPNSSLDVNQISNSEESQSPGAEKKLSSSDKEEPYTLTLDEQLETLVDIYRQYLQWKETSLNKDLGFFINERLQMSLKLRLVFHNQDPHENQTIRNNLITYCETFDQFGIDQDLRQQRQRYANEVIPALYGFALNVEKKYSDAVSGIINFSQYLLGPDYSIAYAPNYSVYSTVRLLITPVPNSNCNAKEIPFILTAKLQFQLGKDAYTRLVSSEKLGSSGTYIIDLHLNALEEHTPTLKELTLTGDTFTELIAKYVEHTVVTIFGSNVLYEVLSKVQIDYAKSFNPLAADHFVSVFKEVIFIYQRFREALVSDIRLREALRDEYGDQFNAVAAQLDGEFRFNCFSNYLALYPKEQRTILHMFNWVDPEAIESRFSSMYDYFEQQSLDEENFGDRGTCFGSLLSVWRNAYDYFLIKEGRYTVIVPKMINACKLAFYFPYSVTVTQHFDSEDHLTMTVSGELSVIKIQLVPHLQTVTKEDLSALFINFRTLFDIDPFGINSDEQAHYLVLTPDQLDQMNKVQLPNELLNDLNLYEGLLKDSASQKVYVNSINAQLKAAMLANLATLFELFIQFSNRYQSDEVFKLSLMATLGDSVLDDNKLLASFIVYLQNVPHYADKIREIFSDNTMLDRCKQYLELEIKRSKDDGRTRRLEMLLAVVIECHQSFADL